LLSLQGQAPAFERAAEHPRTGLPAERSL